jgi:hypothetical protein
MARSQGYWRTTIGASAVPIRPQGNPPEFDRGVYVPPRNQIGPPDVTAAGPLKAVCRFHGLANEPSPEGERVGDVWNFGAGPATRSALAPRLSAPLRGRTRSDGAQAGDSSRDASMNGPQPRSVRQSVPPPTEGIAVTRNPQLSHLESVVGSAPTPASECNSMPYSRCVDAALASETGRLVPRV